MKALLTFIATAVIWTSSFSQTQRQTDLFSGFISNYGKYILQDLAHPLSTCTGANVRSYYWNKYEVKLNYRFGSQLFSCKYTFQLDFTGRFTGFTHECGNEDGGCFILCRLTSLAKITTASDRERYERFLGKSLDDMHCEEYAMVKLFFSWKDKEYFTQY